ncbi:MAG: hypothetical protein K8I82_22150, partial [Anaerolineae bacterium]|nr:hypothetical protein [Anaerolineae bacterium]
MYVDVAVHRAVSATFTYHIPDHLAGKLTPGHLVRISFRTAQESAVVLRLHNDKPDFDTKPVLALLDPQPIVTPVQMELAVWLSETTHTPIGQCLWLMLPPGLAPRGDTLYRLLDREAEGENAAQNHLISLLRRRGDLRNGQIDRAGKIKSWRGTMKKLIERGVVEE